MDGIWKVFPSRIRFDTELVQTFEKAGVKVEDMNKDQFDAWLDLAKQSSYKDFAEKVPGGEKLIDEALAVQ